MAFLQKFTITQNLNIVNLCVSFSHERKSERILEKIYNIKSDPKCKVEAHPQAINYWMKDAQEMLLKGKVKKLSADMISDDA